MSPALRACSSCVILFLGLTPEATRCRRVAAVEEDGHSPTGRVDDVLNTIVYDGRWASSSVWSAAEVCWAKRGVWPLRPDSSEYLL